MEEYFQAGSYEELYEYYNSLESHSPSDDKYWEVGSAWSWMDFVRESKRPSTRKRGLTPITGSPTRCQGERRP